MKKVAIFLAVCFGLISVAHAQYYPYGYQTWKAPVASVAALPASGNSVGDTRFETTSFGIYVWNGSSWQGPGNSGGTVSSVGLADGSTTPIYTISGSPVTGSGTLTFTLGTETANKVFAGPTTGSPAQPTFRSLVTGDIPSLGTIYANVALSNLSSTSVNASLVPGSAGSLALGSSTDYWASGYVSLLGDSSNNVSIDVFNRLFYDSSGVQQMAVTTAGLNLGTAGTTTGQITLESTGSGTYSTLIEPAPSPSPNVVFELPASNGSPGYYLAAGTPMTWASPNPAGLSNPMTTLGDTIYGGASGTPTRLAGSTASTATVLTQTGTGSASAAPAWSGVTGTLGSVVLSASPTITGTLTTTTQSESGAYTNSDSGAASTSIFVLNGIPYPLPSPSPTSSPQPQMIFQPSGQSNSTTWSTGVGGTILGMNEASTFTGNFIDLQKNGTSEFNIDNGGNAIGTGSYNAKGGLTVGANGLTANANNTSLLLGGVRSYTTADMIDMANSTNSGIGAGPLYGIRVEPTWAPSPQPSASPTVDSFAITPTYNESSTAAGSNTDLLINRTETSVGTGNQYLINAEVGGSSKFSVDHSGNTAVSGTLTLSGLTTDGLMYASSSSVIASTGAGTTGQLMLATTSGAPSWSAPTVLTTITPTLSAGTPRVAYVHSIGGGSGVTGQTLSNNATATYTVPAASMVNVVCATNDVSALYYMSDAGSLTKIAGDTLTGSMTVTAPMTFEVEITNTSGGSALFFVSAYN